MRMMDSVAVRRPSFLFTTLFLLGVMVLYPVAGELLFSLAGGASLPEGAGIGVMLGELRAVQAAGQLLVLALPVLVLAAWHVRRRLLSRAIFGFLGVGGRVDFRLVGLAVAGVFMLQPLLYTIAGLQNLFLWPALGEAGAEVVRQRVVMDAFLSELAYAGSLQEFLVVAGVLALVPAVSEELLFRGYVQGNYAASMRSSAAVLLTGTMFAFFHLSAANLVPLALLGWYIGYIYIKSGNLAVPVSVHFVNNFAALLLLALGGGAAAMGPEPEILLGMVWWWVAVPLSLLLFMLVMRRFSSIASAA